MPTDIAEQIKINTESLRTAVATDQGRKDLNLVMDHLAAVSFTLASTEGELSPDVEALRGFVKAVHLALHPILNEARHTAETLRCVARRVEGLAVPPFWMATEKKGECSNG